MYSPMNIKITSGSVAMLENPDHTRSGDHSYRASDVGSDEREKKRPNRSCLARIAGDHCRQWALHTVSPPRAEWHGHFVLCAATYFAKCRSERKISPFSS